MLSINFLVLSGLFLVLFSSYLITLFKIIIRENKFKLDRSSSCNCSEPINRTSNYRVVNGVYVTEDDLDWIASIFVRGTMNGSKEMKYQNFCTGIGNFFFETIDDKIKLNLVFSSFQVINPMFLLTASHCLEPMREHLSIAYAASGLDHDLLNIFGNTNNFRKIDTFYFYPKFKQLINDTTMLRIYDIGS